MHRKVLSRCDKCLRGGAPTGPYGGVDRAPMARGVGVFSGEIEGIFERRGHFNRRINTVYGEVAIGPKYVGIGLPVVCFAGEELGFDPFRVQREDAGQSVAGDAGKVSRSGLVESDAAWAAYPAGEEIGGLGV